MAVQIVVASIPQTTVVIDDCSLRWLVGDVDPADCLIAYTPKGADSLADSYDNNAAPDNGMADGTYDIASAGDEPDFTTANGWDFNGTSDRLATANNITELNSISDFSVIARCVTHTLAGGDSGLRYIASTEGNSAGTTPFILRLNTGDDKVYGYIGGAGWREAHYDNAILADTSYVVAMKYDGSNITVYRDGIAQTPNPEVGNSGTQNRLSVGYCLPYGGRYWDGYIYAVAVHKPGLTTAQIVLMTMAMNAL